MAEPAELITFTAQPLGISFHPFRDILAGGLVDGSVEVHEYGQTKKEQPIESSDESDSDSASDSDSDTSEDSETRKKNSTAPTKSKTTNISFNSLDDDDDTLLDSIKIHDKSCRAVIFSHTGTSIYSGGADGILTCLDTETLKTTWYHKCGSDKKKTKSCKSPLSTSRMRYTRSIAGKRCR
mmetsp:Transcript_38183/g.46584  ORF Transcript_38183/g.46584 Transcript_38183/m.46584 type:complete len:181 (+) Transcript_38183:55-597(+)